MENYTLLLIKPNATEEHHIGAILKIVEENGFAIESLKMIFMDDDLSSRFYSVHKGKPFYKGLIEFMHSGKTVAAILKKDNAIVSLRKLVGNTDSKKAESGTIRHLYGEDIRRNAVHASDSSENAKKEISIIFPDFRF
ncbi:MAG TPA: nucleoside-diphosphate kinase [Candidatus Cloacimonetes bacterium]|nr:nucleoside-diphosphate kinase [Candidatus Cloacimonadota bacterium]